MRPRLHAPSVRRVGRLALALCALAACGKVEDGREPGAADGVGGQRCRRRM